MFTPVSQPPVRKLYIAGPMSGIRQCNFPAFDRLAKRLRDDGYEVVSPAELDSEQERAAALQSEDGACAAALWSQCLARDIVIVADEVDGVVVLPGWQESRGARLEVFVALLCNKPIFTDVNFGHNDHSPIESTPTLLRQLSVPYVLTEIVRSFWRA